MRASVPLPGLGHPWETHRQKADSRDAMRIDASGKEIGIVARDPGEIGLWGGSYGGYLTAWGLAHNSDLFAAGVDCAWRPRLVSFLPMSFPRMPQTGKRH